MISESLRRLVAVTPSVYIIISAMMYPHQLQIQNLMTCRCQSQLLKPSWHRVMPIWMTACLLLFYPTISTFFVVFCLNAILIRTVLGLGAMNLYWQPSVTVETFLKDNCLKICIDILFSCVLSTVCQRLKWIEVKCNHQSPSLHRFSSICSCRRTELIAW